MEVVPDSSDGVAEPAVAITCNSELLVIHTPAEDIRRVTGVPIVVLPPNVLSLPDIEIVALGAKSVKLGFCHSNLFVTGQSSRVVVGKTSVKTDGE